MSETLTEEVKAVEAKVEAVASEVKTEAVKVVEQVKAEATKLSQEITAEEKLAIRDIENTYLKAQIEINRLSQITQNAQKNFTNTVEGLTKKYVVDPAVWVFDNAELIFRKK